MVSTCESWLQQDVCSTLAQVSDSYMRTSSVAKRPVTSITQTFHKIAQQQRNSLDSPKLYYVIIKYSISILASDLNSFFILKVFLLLGTLVISRFICDIFFHSQKTVRVTQTMLALATSYNDLQKQTSAQHGKPARSCHQLQCKPGATCTTGISTDHYRQAVVAMTHATSIQRVFSHLRSSLQLEVSAHIIAVALLKPGLTYYHQKVSEWRCSFSNAFKLLIRSLLSQHFTNQEPVSKKFLLVKHLRCCKNCIQTYKVASHLRITTCSTW